MAGSKKKYGRNQPREAVITAPHLPLEIVVLIISRLPVKSLCRFRCVSKSWLSTISSPQFAKTHLDLAFQNNTQSQILICWLDDAIYCVDWDSINDDDVNDKGLVAVELDHPLKDNPTLWSCDSIPYSSNGLVCVLSRYLNTLLVINPCTGESRRIPEKTFFDYSFISSCSHGFGYASKSDDYKLVRIDCGVVTIYSLRSDTWHRIEPACLARYNFPFSSSCSGELLGVLLNGAVHWTCVLVDDGNHGLILAFDLEEETFREMSMPFLELEFRLDDEDIANMSVGVLNGCLCVGSYDHLWLMREYNNGESWTRISGGNVCLKKPFGFSKNGDISPEVNGELTLCKFEDGTHGIPIGPKFRVGTYVESLISPNAYVGRWSWMLEQMRGTPALELVRDKRAILAKNAKLETCWAWNNKTARRLRRQLDARWRRESRAPMGLTDSVENPSP